MSGYTKEIHKTLLGCVSQDVLRPALAGVLLETNNGVTCNLTAMDGRLGVHYKDIIISDLEVFIKIEYGFNLPKPQIGEEMLLYLEPKIRKKLKFGIIEKGQTYVNWKGVIPEKWECDFAKRPVFMTEQLERLRKLFNIKTYFPDKRNGLKEVTIKYLDVCGSFLYLMPVENSDKDWIHYNKYSK